MKLQRKQTREDPGKPTSPGEPLRPARRERILSASAQFKPPPRAAIRRRDEKADFLRISMISGNTKSIPVLVRAAADCFELSKNGRIKWKVLEVTGLIC